MSEGIACPKCGQTGYTRVMQTWNQPGRIRRRRTCLNCGKIFYTEERLEERPWTPTSKTT